MQLRHATVLVTGGASGIGLEIARQLVRRDNTVIIADRHRSALAAAQALVPDLHVFKADVTDAASVSRLYAGVSRAFPELNVLVNCAGALRRIDVKDDWPLTDLTHEVDVNLKGVIWMTAQFLPLLLCRPRGAIVNISSALAYVPMAIAPIHSASKAGVRAFTRALREQLAQSSLEVFEVAPPLTHHAQLDDGVGANHSLIAAMRTDLVAKCVIDDIERGFPEICIGSARLLKLLGRAAPDLAFRQLNRTAAA